MERTPFLSRTHRGAAAKKNIERKENDWKNQQQKRKQFIGITHTHTHTHTHKRKRFHESLYGKGISGSSSFVMELL